MPKRNRGYILTSTGAQKLREAKRGWEIQHSHKCTQEKMRDLTSTFKENGLDTGTIRKIFKAEKEVDKESIRCLFRAFKLQLDDGDSEQVKQNDVSSLVSSSMKELETGEDLMSLAISMLEQLGFDKLFKITGSLPNIGYRFHEPYDGDKGYQLILFQNEDSLSISLPQYILEPYVLILKYWEHIHHPGDYAPLYLDEAIAGIFLVLPSKREVFLNLLHPNYWNLLAIEEKTIGAFSLNEVSKYYGEDSILPSPILDNFCPETLSNRDTYLVLNENKIFPNTWQMCISSGEILQEIIIKFGNLLLGVAMDNTPLPYSNIDDIPF